jgi:segregation and condensation protein A
MQDNSTVQYTGPYDMLLQLMQQKDISISDVSLSSITEEFLVYINTLEEKEATEIADFLTVAAKLLLLKSSLLLPTFQLAIEEDGVSLTDRLKLYEQFIHASGIIESLWMDGAVLLTHHEPFIPTVSFSWPESLNAVDMCATMKRIIHAAAPPKQLPKTQIDHTVSLKQTIERLRAVLKQGTSTSFWQHADKTNKTSVIIHFLALLELTKLGAVIPAQAQHFTDITLDVQ